MRHVAILGAGIMGAATALLLARRRVRVTLFDQADQPFAGASRWNEGKIHLGYLYAADASFDTARRLIPGGLAFKSLTEELVGRSIDPAIAEHDDVYAIHRDSVVGAEAAAAYYDAVAALVATRPGVSRYPGYRRGARPRRLSRVELETAYDTAHIVAGFKVPERSVSTTWIADRFVDALAAEPRIEQRMRERVRGVRCAGEGSDPRLRVETDAGIDGPFDAVVNALWEGRLAVDASFGLGPPATWSHRHRLSAFVRTSSPAEAPSTVIATGPFGDVKNYGGRALYLSWYTAGLVAEGTALAPPAVPPMDDGARTRLVADIIDRLGALVPAVRAVASNLESVTLAGGWVYAAGQGSLADPRSTLHRRDRAGIQRRGRYVSVDTGKYSIGPWLAREVADLIT
jgi:glycine/D-amino acid oxidase-like deaminating enzyme